MPEHDLRILICYDGSEHAKHAITSAAQLFPGATTTVLNITESLTYVLQRYPAPESYAVGIPFDTIDEHAAEMSNAVANDGAALATEVGLRVEAQARVSDVCAWQAALDFADEIKADVVITGERGLSGVRGLVRGSFSHHILQHSSRPVLIIPDPALSHSRRHAVSDTE